LSQAAVKPFNVKFLGKRNVT